VLWLEKAGWLARMENDHFPFHFQFHFHFHMQLHFHFHVPANANKLQWRPGFSALLYLPRKPAGKLREALWGGLCLRLCLSKIVLAHQPA